MAMPEVRLKGSTAACSPTLLTAGLQGLAPCGPGGQPRVGVWLTNSPSPLLDRRDWRRPSTTGRHPGSTPSIRMVWSRGATFQRSRFAPIEPACLKADASLTRSVTSTSGPIVRAMKVIPCRYADGAADAEGCAVTLGMACCAAATAAPVPPCNGAEPQTRRSRICGSWLNPPTLGCGPGSSA